MSLRHELDNLFSRFTNEWEGGLIPSLDMSETANSVEIRMDVPGMKPEQIDVQVSGNTVTISGERKEERHEKKGDGREFHRVERRSGSFSRSVVLPCNVDEGQASAAYHDGVLTLTLPKTEAAKVKKISVKQT